MSSNIRTIDAGRFKNCVFFSLTLRRQFGNRAKIKDAAKLSEYLILKKAATGTITTNAVEMDGAARATKSLIVSEPFNNLNEFMAGVKDKLVGRFGKATPSKIKDGLFTVATALVKEFEDDLSKAEKQLQEEFVPPFLADFPNAIERAKTVAVKDGGLGPLFEAGDYPDVEELRGAFGFEWQWLALSVPEGLPEGLKAAAQEKLEKQFSDAADEITMALRKGFLELIEHASDKLAPPGPGEKPKIFRNSLIENVQAFIDSFGARNVMNDAELAVLVDRAKAVLASGANGATLTPEKLRQYANVRDATKKQFDEIKTTLDGMLTEKSSRKFQLDE